MKIMLDSRPGMEPLDAFFRRTEGVGHQLCEVVPTANGTATVHLPIQVANFQLMIINDSDQPTLVNLPLSVSPALLTFDQSVLANPQFVEDSTSCEMDTGLPLSTSGTTSQLQTGLSLSTSGITWQLQTGLPLSTSGTKSHLQTSLPPPTPMTIQQFERLSREPQEEEDKEDDDLMKPELIDVSVGKNEICTSFEVVDTNGNSIIFEMHAPIEPSDRDLFSSVLDDADADLEDTLQNDEPIAIQSRSVPGKISKSKREKKQLSTALFYDRKRTMPVTESYSLNQREGMSQPKVFKRAEDTLTKRPALTIQKTNLKSLLIPNAQGGVPNPTHKSARASQYRPLPPGLIQKAPKLIVAPPGQRILGLARDGSVVFGKMTSNNKAMEERRPQSAQQSATQVDYRENKMLKTLLKPSPLKRDKQQEKTNSSETNTHYKRGKAEMSVAPEHPQQSETTKDSQTKRRPICYEKNDITPARLPSDLVKPDQVTGSNPEAQPNGSVAVPQQALPTNTNNMEVCSTSVSSKTSNLAQVPSTTPTEASTEDGDSTVDIVSFDFQTLAREETVCTSPPEETTHHQDPVHVQLCCPSSPVGRVGYLMDGCDALDPVQSEDPTSPDFDQIMKEQQNKYLIYQMIPPYVFRNADPRSPVSTKASTSDAPDTSDPGLSTIATEAKPGDVGDIAPGSPDSDSIPKEESGCYKGIKTPNTVSPVLDHPSPLNLQSMMNLSLKIDDSTEVGLEDPQNTVSSAANDSPTNAKLQYSFDHVDPGSPGSLSATRTEMLHDEGRSPSNIMSPKIDGQPVAELCRTVNPVVKVPFPTKPDVEDNYSAINIVSDISPTKVINENCCGTVNPVSSYVDVQSSDAEMSNVGSILHETKSRQMTTDLEEKIIGSPQQRASDKRKYIGIIIENVDKSRTYLSMDCLDPVKSDPTKSPETQASRLKALVSVYTVGTSETEKDNIENVCRLESEKSGLTSEGNLPSVIKAGSGITSQPSRDLDDTAKIVSELKEKPNTTVGHVPERMEMSMDTGTESEVTCTTNDLTSTHHHQVYTDPGTLDSTSQPTTHPASSPSNGNTLTAADDADNADTESSRVKLVSKFNFQGVIPEIRRRLGAHVKATGDDKTKQNTQQFTENVTTSKINESETSTICQDSVKPKEDSQHRLTSPPGISVHDQKNVFVSGTSASSLQFENLQLTSENAVIHGIKEQSEHQNQTPGTLEKTDNLKPNQTKSTSIGQNVYETVKSPTTTTTTATTTTTTTTTTEIALEQIMTSKMTTAEATLEPETLPKITTTTETTLETETLLNITPSTDMETELYCSPVNSPVESQEMNMTLSMDIETELYCSPVNSPIESQEMNDIEMSRSDDCSSPPLFTIANVFSLAEVENEGASGATWEQDDGGSPWCYPAAGALWKQDLKTPEPTVTPYRDPEETDTASSPGLSYDGDLENRILRGLESPLNTHQQPSWSMRNDENMRDLGGVCTSEHWKMSQSASPSYPNHIPQNSMKNVDSAYGQKKVFSYLGYLRDRSQLMSAPAQEVSFDSRGLHSRYRPEPRAQPEDPLASMVSHPRTYPYGSEREENIGGPVASLMGYGKINQIPTVGVESHMAHRGSLQPPGGSGDSSVGSADPGAAGGGPVVVARDRCGQVYRLNIPRDLQAWMVQVRQAGWRVMMTIHPPREETQEGRAQVNMDLQGQPQQVNTDLQGQPQQVNKDLQGQPQQVNTDLQGQPQHVNTDFQGQPQQVNTDLQGQPQQVNKDLQGQPQQVNTDLQGQPQQVNTDFQGQPQQVNTDLQGQPQQVNTDFQGQPQQVNTDFQGQPQQVNTDLQGQPQRVNTDLQGQPQQVNTDFQGQPQQVDTDLQGQHWVGREQVNLDLQAQQGPDTERPAVRTVGPILVQAQDGRQFYARANLFACRRPGPTSGPLTSAPLMTSTGADFLEQPGRTGGVNYQAGTGHDLPGPHGDGGRSSVSRSTNSPSELLPQHCTCERPPLYPRPPPRPTQDCTYPTFQLPLVPSPALIADPQKTVSLTPTQSSSPSAQGPITYNPLLSLATAQNFETGCEHSPRPRRLNDAGERIRKLKELQRQQEEEVQRIRNGKRQN